MRYVAAGVLAMAVLLAIRSCQGATWPQTFDEGLQQYNNNVKEGEDNTRYWIERHEQEDQTKALHDIEDAIIFDSLERGDD